MLAALLLSGISLTLPAAGTDNPRADLLVEASDLLRPGAEAAFVLDARGRSNYLAGHVPGAVWVDHPAWSKSFASDWSASTWARRLGTLGIRPNGRVVIYDDAQSKDAARIWWILRYCGIRDVRLLNGGYVAWVAAKGKVETTDVHPTPTVVTVEPRTDRLATKDHVLRALGDSTTQIVDARSSGEFCGEVGSEKRKGAIPHAAHLEWSDLLDAKTQRFKNREELAQLFATAGIDLDKPAITYCQSGGRASVMAFALELMGVKDVRNYYKSWAEWANAADTPVQKPMSKK